MCIYIFFLNFYSFINLLSFKSLSLNRKHVAFKAQILPQTLGTLDSVFIPPPPPETSLRTYGGVIQGFTAYYFSVTNVYF